MPKKENTRVLDVIIIGGGIAAHAAAIYTARASLHPLVISGTGLDQLSLTTTVENYPGFPDGIQGPDLIENCKKQAQKFGATYLPEDANSFAVNTDKTLTLGAGKKTYTSRTVIITTGASARTLGIPGEDKYFGRGVSTCATCDAAVFRNKDVVVVGGGDSAMEETLSLYKFANKIHIVHRRDSFKASKIMQDRVLKLTDKITIHWNSAPTKVLGDGRFVTGAAIKDVTTNKETTIPCQGMFLAIGHIPNTKIFEGTIALDQGYIVHDERKRTNVPGAFAAGDVQDHLYKQAITSAGSGCQAALEAERYIEHLKAEGAY